MSYTTEILPPIHIERPESAQWGKVCDVLVIGWGAAGACTALEAKANGADVIIADRFDGGGASAKSGGVVYAGGGTTQQQNAGYEDSPEAMFEYLKHETQGVISDETLKRFCNQSRDNLTWLESKGTPYSHEVPPGGKTSYPPVGYYLYYSGNEQVPAYQSSYPHAPRGHRTVGKGHGGMVLYHHLKEACLKEGIKTMTQSAARRLVIDDSGQVIGAEMMCIPADTPEARLHHKLSARAEKLQNLSPAYCDRLRRRVADIEQQHAKPMLVRALKGVALTTGGFIFNRELLKQQAPKYTRNFKIGATGCDGSGVRLGASVDASSDRMDRVSAWRFINPPGYWPKGIVVNSQGKRFCNEEVYGATLGYEMCEHQEGKAWLVLDKNLRWASIKQCLFGGYWWFQSVPALVLMILGARKGKTLEALAARCGMDAEAFKRDIDAYNQAIAHGEVDPFGKSKDYSLPVKQGPFYALDISVKSPVFPLGSLTLGGMKVNEETGQVLDDHGNGINGLYAAGRAAIGIPSNLYISGLSLADCVFSGRRAGQSMAGLEKKKSSVSKPQIEAAVG
ncbi:FAD-binding protein [Endozoicomonas ascidiicola]|uniref:FAD-binding protein n=1 Tax=Endozoicomonas ascidiicola TaxID=1698521 RepID=UPI00082D95FA|nr:FAD-binding protein [Endozoicomonas ascidiicola]